MLNAIPIVGWILSFVISTFLAIPFWFIWTYLGIGALFEFLPNGLQAPGFWATVGSFMCLSILRAVMLPFGSSKNDD